MHILSYGCICGGGGGGGAAKHNRDDSQEQLILLQECLAISLVHYNAMDAL